MFFRRCQNKARNIAVADDICMMKWDSRMWRRNMAFLKRFSNSETCKLRRLQLAFGFSRKRLTQKAGSDSEWLILECLNSFAFLFIVVSVIYCLNIQWQSILFIQILLLFQNGLILAIWSFEKFWAIFGKNQYFSWLSPSLSNQASN